MSDSLIKLDAIIGEQLSSVEFVQDYVQLHFGGPHIIAYVWPVVESGGEFLHFGEGRYRDALCERISRKVLTASIREGVTAAIEFDDGATMRISGSQKTAPGRKQYSTGLGAKRATRYWSSDERRTKGTGRRLPGLGPWHRVISSQRANSSLRVECPCLMFKL